jgi:endoglucanase
MDLPGIRSTRRRRRTAVAIVVALLLFFSAVSVVSLNPQSRLWSGQWSGLTWPATNPVPGDPVSMTTGLYVDPRSQPAKWVQTHPGDPRQEAIKTGIADMPLSRWFLGEDHDLAEASKYVRGAEQADKLPVLVAYNIPGRDCGQFSAGGADGSVAYRRWIDGLASAVGQRPAVVVLEPDALAQLDCRPDTQRNEALALIAYAVDEFANRAPNSWVYIDAGHSNWVDAATMAERLRHAHIGNARGFSLNVSNYQPTDANAAYGQEIVDLMEPSGLHPTYVIDTSRNGRPPAGSEWCNPAGQRIGDRPRPGGAYGLDLQLWVKPPGEYDGACGVAPEGNAGDFQPSAALELLTGADGGQWLLGLRKSTGVVDPAEDPWRRDLGLSRAEPTAN